MVYQSPIRFVQLCFWTQSEFGLSRQGDCASCTWICLQSIIRQFSKKLKPHYHRNLPIRQAICLRMMCRYQGNDIWLGQRTNFGGGIEQWPYKMMLLLNQQNVQSPHFGREAHFELFYCVSVHLQYCVWAVCSEIGEGSEAAWLWLEREEIFVGAFEFSLMSRSLSIQGSKLHVRRNSSH